MFKLYCIIGGYPAIIEAYRQGGDIKELTERVDWLMTVFTKESARYFPDVADKTLYARIMRAVASILVNEKKGLSDVDKNMAENIIKHLVLRKDEEQNIRITKNSIYKATYWMWQSSLIDMCGKCLGCSPLRLVDNSRYYFTDMGTAYRHLDPIATTDARDGMIAENFAYLQLRDVIPEQRLIPEHPCFGEYDGGEIDFVVANRHEGTRYAVEVKSRRSSSKTAELLLQKNIVDYVVYAKGDTYGGKADRKLTIPLYLLKRFVFEDYTDRSKVELPKPPIAPTAVHFNAE